MNVDPILFTAYCAAVVITTAVEHALFGDLNEVARRAMGIATVLVITAVFFVVGDLGDLSSLLVITAGFLSAATALGFLLALDRRKALAIKRRMVDRINEAKTNRK
jgi:hypothetical protein